MTRICGKSCDKTIINIKTRKPKTKIPKQINQDQQFKKLIFVVTIAITTKQF